MQPVHHIWQTGCILVTKIIAGRFCHNYFEDSLQWKTCDKAFRLNFLMKNESQTCLK
jgi:hypothetical protein